MSVLIKGFNMPKDGCKDCTMVKRGNVFDICPFLKREVNGNVERGGKPNGCPLVEVSDINTGDMIYRQTAIDAIDETDWYHQNENKDMVSGANSAEHQPWFKSDDVYSALKSVPSAPRWTPVSEGLPKPNETERKSCKYYLVQNEYGDMMVATYRRNTTGVTWWEQMYAYKPVEDKITAWMPLPKPWKGENDDC